MTIPQFQALFFISILFINNRITTKRQRLHTRPWNHTISFNKPTCLHNLHKLRKLLSSQISSFYLAKPLTCSHQNLNQISLFLQRLTPFRSVSLRRLQQIRNVAPISLGNNETSLSTKLRRPILQQTHRTMRQNNKIKRKQNSTRRGQTTKLDLR